MNREYQIMKLIKVTACFIILFLLFPALFSSRQVYAGDGLPTGARAIAMGGTSVTLSDNYSLFNNQAGMAFIKKSSASISSQRGFMLSEFNTAAGGVTLPTKSGVFGVNVSYFGFNVYNEKSAGLSYARLFSETISGGVQLDYHSTAISEYGTQSAVTFEAGLLVKIFSQLNFGAHVYNPVRAQLGFYEDERLPTVFRAGLGYTVSDKVLLTIETEKDMDYSARFKGGLEYKPSDKIFLRGGFMTNPFRSCFGAGYRIKDFDINLAAAYHQLLGFTPNFSLSYEFGKK